MKGILCIVVIFCFTYTCFCQEIWLKGGVGQSQLSWETTSVFDTKFSSFTSHLWRPTAAIEFEYFQKKRLSLSSDVGYYNGGGKVHNRDGYNPYFKWYAETKRLSVPSLYASQVFNLYPFEKDGYTPFISFGPRIDYLIKKQENNVALTYLENNNALNQWRLGLTGKIGLKYAAKRMDIRFDIARFWSLKNLAYSNSISSPIEIQSINVTSSAYCFTIGIGYSLKKRNSSN